ncbi:MAG: enoyl-CoA hydratase/isomerase family protein [Candidatus Marinimicrobia bacterium]|nr:enoyl-CoA hydratase/isomerase family protein [Candidatus Neomarinimicrobiota bacterium]
MSEINNMVRKILKESLHDGQVVRLTLNAPKGNVLDSEMMSELQSALEGLQNQKEVKLVQFIGAGDHFSYGASVREHTRDKASGMLKQFHQLFYTLIDLAIPTAALVSGQCLGGGFELALMCNFLFLDQSARLGQPEINLGVFAPPASLILPMKIGQSKADDLLLTGRAITADEAVEMGLVTNLFDDKKTMLSEVDTWVEEHILPKSASSLKFAVKAARQEFNETLRKQLHNLEKFYLDELMSTHDANEGIESFLKRREPKWENR